MTNQVLSPDLLAKYKPSQYHKVVLPTGPIIVLNDGVKPVAGTTKQVQLATLYGPDNQKQVVVSGSDISKYAGWGLTPGSYKAPTAGPTNKDNGGGSSGPVKIVNTLDEAKAKAAEIFVSKFGYDPNQSFIDSEAQMMMDRGGTQGALDTLSSALGGNPNAYKYQTDVPKELVDDQNFQALDHDNKMLASYNWKVLAQQNADRAKAFDDALTKARDQADPYWREKINVVKDELARSFGTIDADLAARETELTNRKKAIEEDLTVGREYLTASQQAELARQSEDYTSQIDDVREQMARTGLSSSTIRSKAEEKQARLNAGVIGSIQREGEYKIGSLERTSARDITSIENDIATYKRQAQETKVANVRKSEAYLGSGELSSEYGSYLLGGLSGDIVGEKAGDIQNRVAALMAAAGYGSTLNL